MFTFPKDGSTRTLEQLRVIKVPERSDVSDRWKGVAHGELADAILGSAEKNGLRLKEAGWAVAGPQGEDLYGSVEFLREDVIPAPGGVVYALGVVHSNRSRYALRLVVGGKVLVCGNGMTSGETTDCGKVNRKHTTGLKVEEAVNAAMVRWIERLRDVDETVKQLVAVDLSGARGDRVVEHVLVEAGRRDLFPWSGLGKVDAEWRKPRHLPFLERTGWSLYNAATETVKLYSPDRQLRVMDAFSRLILAGAGLN